MDDLVRHVARFATAENLFKRAPRVFVAVSGGPDSVACLLVLLELRERFGLDITAAHFDHQLQSDSRANLEWVRAFCEARDVPCLTGEGDVAAAAKRERASIEDMARRMRYGFLGFIAAEKRMDGVITGHTADDQAETVLLRLLRGTGVRGLRGMLPVAPLPGAPSLRLVRPLLTASREQTVAYCRARGVEPLHDPSNHDVSLRRNRVRHEVLATLRAVNPSIDDALRGVASSAREVFAGVERQALGLAAESRGPEGSVFERKPLATLPNEGLSLVIEREAAFHKLTFEVNRTRLENLRTALNARGGLVRFGSVEVEVSAGRARIGPAIEPEPLPARTLEVPGLTRAGHWTVEVRTESFSGESSGVPVNGAAGALRIRSLEPADRILHHGIERSVADLLANAHVPSWSRRRTAVLAQGGRVVAVLTPAATFVQDGQPPEESALYVRGARV